MKLLEFLIVVLQTLFWPLYLVLKVCGVLLLLLYLLLPLLMYLQQSKKRWQPNIEFVDWDSYPLPDPVREQLQQGAGRLQEQGFLPGLFYLIPSGGSPVENVSLVFYHPVSYITAQLMMTYVKIVPAPPLPPGASPVSLEIGPLSAKNIEKSVPAELLIILSNRYRGTGLPALLTTNSPIFSPSRPGSVTYQFPHITEIGRLLELHEKLGMRHFAHSEKYFDLRQFTPEGFRQSLLRPDRQITEDVDSANQAEAEPQQTSLFEAYRICWTQLSPLSPILKKSRLRRSRRLEQELLGSSV